ncbi:MAG: hypothetical protein IJZ57_02740 [Clostridia bacterium]|nr:hypothetical protein [Clostridia bacterium]
MKVTDKIVKFRIQPYIQEASLQFIMDLIVIVLVTVVFVVADFPVVACVLFDLLYFTVAVIFHYKTLIQAILDRNKRDFVTEKISIKQFKEEFSFAGDRMGHSYIRIFYPKEMYVDKYKFNIINDKGEEKKLRAVMSFKRTLKFIVFDKNEIEYLNVTYLRKSKIIICFDMIEDIDKIPSKRKRAEIEKAINYINKAI